MSPQGPAETSVASISRFKAFVLGARPRTLPAAVVPVAVGTGVAWWWRGVHGVEWWKGLLALVVALAVQIATNYANDYSDGVRGTDKGRVGPLRLVASGLAKPGEVRLASFAAFGVAGIAGLVLGATTSWWLVAVGAGCFAAGWLYTGGPRPYGYMGLGEVFVLGFFGVVATCGTTYVEGVRIASRGLLVALIASLAVGLLAAALLQANNIRDIAGDSSAGKKTVAVRLGRRGAGFLYVATLVLAAALVIVVAVIDRPWAAIALVAAPLALRPAGLARSGAEGRDLIPMLAGTARLQLCFGILLAIGLVI
jgi:1,4-dihydroxy-2-naphthoate octaprenyltransferase